VTGVADLNWFALQVRPRSEKSVATQLEGRGYTTCLPVQQLRRQWSDRVKVVETPVFPGYVFCEFNPSHRLPVLTTPGVASVVSFGKGPAPVDAAEIQAIQAAAASGLTLQPWPFLRAGDRVRINYGTLRGVEGILLDLRGNYRVILSVSLLQRSVSLEVDSAWVTRLEPVRARNENETAVAGWVVKPASV
jgi:transcription antitermination factor NusG